ncbi:MAG TPA: DUF2062 domain-containing protein [Candidatus Hydrogenedentes bacterium]|nr:DUF2062 domain-containing protein [Candidatus Hydrogenedentota bacterium]
MPKTPNDISRIWAVIPVFNNKDTVVDVARQARHWLEHVVVVDDGSTDTDVEKLFSGADITVLKHERNLGKGAALCTALNYLHGKDAVYMLTLDADGQHDPNDIEHFLPLLQEDDGTIILGVRDFNAPNVPKSSRFGRAFSNFWLHLETGQMVEDSQSGFRAYPVNYLAQMKLEGRRYDFEVEVLTRAVWSGLTLKQVPIRVFYPPAELRVSSFRPVLDNVRISLMHMRLVGRRLIPWPHPKLIKRGRAGNAINSLMHPIALLKRLLRENATPLGLAVSAGVGIFMGTLPLIFMHILAIAYVTARLHLNAVMALAVQNLCMPPFVPLACIGVGHFVLYRQGFDDVTWRTVVLELPDRLLEWLIGSLILAPVLASVMGVIVFIFARLFQRMSMGQTNG